MGTYSEIGLLALLIFAFSAPLLTDVVARYRGTDEEDENR